MSKNNFDANSLLDWSFYKVFPEVFINILQTISRSTRIQLQAPMMGLLALTSSCVGKSTFLRLKPGYEVPGNLFLVLVASSATAKSPATNPFMMALSKAEKDLGISFSFTGSTWAGMRDEFADSERGMLMYNDEISGFFESIGKDHDFSTKIMQAYDVRDMKFIKKRAGGVTERIFIDKACLSVFGTIQPKVLHSVFSGANQSSGFSSRFLYSMIPNTEASGWEDEGVPDFIDRELNGFAKYLLKLNADAGKPIMLRMSPDAKSIYIDWYDALAYQYNEGQVSIISQENNFRKIQDQVARLAVNLHFMRQYWSEKTSYEVSAESMLGAIFIGEYFRLEYEKMIFLASNHKPEKNVDIIEVLSAVVESKDKIDEGRLPTSIIKDAFNSSKDDVEMISADSMGRKMRALVHLFPRCKKGTRGYKVTPESIRQAELKLAEYRSVLGV